MIASHDMALARRRAIGLLMDHTIRVLAEVDAQQEAEEEASAEFVSRGEWREGTSPSRSVRTVRDSLPSYGSRSSALG